MTMLLLLAFLGALFVDIKAQIDSLRKRRRISLFRYGAVGNWLFAFYYSICAILGALVTIVGMRSHFPFFEIPDPILALKAFYLGFAISTNLAFLNRIIGIRGGKIDDLTIPAAYKITPWEKAERHLLRFRDELSRKF